MNLKNSTVDEINELVGTWVQIQGWFDPRTGDIHPAEQGIIVEAREWFGTPEVEVFSPKSRKKHIVRFHELTTLDYQPAWTTDRTPIMKEQR